MHVMSFNLRFASDEEPNAWPRRRPVMGELLRQERPDLIGTQEGLYDQLDDVAAELGPDYGAIGLGREGGSRGEFMMIFFTKDRLRPREFDHFWLSDTPNVIGSQSWGGCAPRMVTWARFADTHTGAEFYAINTHFEVFDTGAREKSADLLLARLTELDPALPVVVTGDFNAPAEPGQTVYDALVTTGPLVDTWVTAAERGPAFATFHGYRPPEPDGVRIDWILASPSIRTSRTWVNTFHRDDQYPSDHLPVQAILELPTGG